MRKPTILAVLAHPDDETFGLGGTLALYAARGADVHLICGTRGESGDVDEKYLQNFSSISDLRMNELHCAAEKLKLKSFDFLDYRDSGMAGSPENLNPQALANAPIDQVALSIAEKIRSLRPQIVVTHDPIGTYCHPDHIAIHQATSYGFFNAGNPELQISGLQPYLPQRLYFQTFPHAMLQWMMRIFPILGLDPKRFGRNHDIDLTEIASVAFPRHVTVYYRSVSKIRDEAAMCHASQGGGQQARGFLAWFRRLTAAYKEDYMQAYPVPTKGKKSRDLFEGVNLEEAQ
jgi:LmbE family N-acetylglucosaminyl deacetylase